MFDKEVFKVGMTATAFQAQLMQITMLPRTTAEELLSKFLEVRPIKIPRTPGSSPPSSPQASPRADDPLSPRSVFKPIEATQSFDSDASAGETPQGALTDE